MLNVEQAKVICRIEEQKQLAKQLNLTGWEKYLEEDQFVDEKVEVFKILKLDQLPSARVLDIGAGIGHFGSLCKHYGHEYLGTYFGRASKSVIPFFEDAGLKGTDCAVFPFQDKVIPAGPWDCIVMIRTTFELNEEWATEDWQELVQVCMDNLTPGGQLLIKSNLAVELKRKYGRLETQCHERMMAAFSNKTPLPQWSWATWHWVKE